MRNRIVRRKANVATNRCLSAAALLTKRGSTKVGPGKRGVLVSIGLDRGYDHRHAQSCRPPARTGDVDRAGRSIAQFGIGIGIGIGSDLAAGVTRTKIPDFSGHGRIVSALPDRGLTQEEVDKMCSGNWLRVLGAVRA
jgi:microsomal dipeptidase-like Zn-dependent dipeptidase